MLRLGLCPVPLEVLRLGLCPVPPSLSGVLRLGLCPVPHFTCLSHAEVLGLGLCPVPPLFSGVLRLGLCPVPLCLAACHRCCPCPAPALPRPARPLARPGLLPVLPLPVLLLPLPSAAVRLCVREPSGPVSLLTPNSQEQVEYCKCGEPLTREREENYLHKFLEGVFLD